jgi:hypothetical protein
MRVRTASRAAAPARYRRAAAPERFYGPVYRLA